MKVDFLFKSSRLWYFINLTEVDYDRHPPTQGKHSLVLLNTNCRSINLLDKATVVCAK